MLDRAALAVGGCISRTNMTAASGALIWLLALLCCANASVYIWNQPAGGNFAVPSYWLVNGVPGSVSPGPNDDCYINATGSYTVTSYNGITVNSVTVGNPGSSASTPTLAIDASILAVKSSVTIWEFGRLTLQGSGSLTLAPGGSQPPFVLCYGVIQTLGSNTAQFTLTDGATFSLLAPGMLNSTTPGISFLPFQPPGDRWTFVVTGTIIPVPSVSPVCSCSVCWRCCEPCSCSDDIFWRNYQRWSPLDALGIGQ